MNKEVEILGTKYKVIIKEQEEDARLIKNWGFTDFYTKEIVIASDCIKETEETCRNLIKFKNKVIRHEIIHAFLYESGMKECSNSASSWVENEEMIDYFAIQIPKIVKVYKELGVIDE